MGKDATYEVRQLPEYRSTITFEVNKKQVVCPKFIEVNGQLVSEYYSIQEGDELKLLSYYTLENLLAFMDLPYTEHIYVNNRPAGKDEKVYENFSVEWSLEEKRPDMTLDEVLNIEADAAREVYAAAEEKVQEEVPLTQAPPVSDTAADLPVIVNGKPVTLKGKSSYCFVDILDFYPFDVSIAHGQTVVMQINGNQAEFTSPLSAGDIIDLYWK